MPNEHTYTVAARDHTGRASLWRVGSTDHGAAADVVALEIGKNNPAKAPKVVLVGINGGKK